MHKLWVVLKVSLTRPWVWLMMFFGAFQLFPLVLFIQSRPASQSISTFPGFDRGEEDSPQLPEIQQLARDRRLKNVEVLFTRNLPGSVTFSETGEFVGEQQTVMVNGQRVQVPLDSSRWPLLAQFPELKSLIMQPPNLLTAEAWQRIGALSQLEELTLADVGSVNPDASNTAPADLYAALSQLKKLRHLNMRNTCGDRDWELPPLPNLEYVILGSSRNLESVLEALAKHSPKLQTLSLSTFPNYVFPERTLAAMRQMPNLRRVYVSGQGMAAGSGDNQQQLDYLRTHLPGIAVYRGDYSPNRLMICGSLLVLAGFLTFVVWFQSGLTLAQPLAAVMPGHRGPHLFWPVGTSLLAILFSTAGALYVGAKLPPALALACLFSTWMSTILQGHDIRPDWRRITNLVLMVDVLCLFTLLGMGAKSLGAVDGFLMGDYPVLANVLMLWFLFGVGWKFVRASRLHRILAESGMPGIPGLNLGMQHMYDQPFKPAPGWSMTSWQFKRMGNAIDRRITSMDRASWISMLRAGAPTRLGLGFGLIVVVCMLLMFHLMSGIRPVQTSNQSRLHAVNSMQAVMQATLILLIANVQSWVGRRGSVAADFLRPVSREKFWSVLRMAIFHDLKPCLLLALVGGGLASYHANKAAISPLGVLLTLICVTGCFAFIHAWVVRLVISKRLVMDTTLAMVTSMVIVAMAVASVMMEGNDRPPSWVVIMLALGVMACGGWMQRDLARKLANWELG